MSKALDFILSVRDKSDSALKTFEDKVQRSFGFVARRSTQQFKASTRSMDNFFTSFRKKAADLWKFGLNKKARAQSQLVAQYAGQGTGGYGPLAPQFPTLPQGSGTAPQGGGQPNGPATGPLGLQGVTGRFASIAIIWESIKRMGQAAYSFLRPGIEMQNTLVGVGLKSRFAAENLDSYRDTITRVSNTTGLAIRDQQELLSILVKGQISAADAVDEYVMSAAKGSKVTGVATASLANMAVTIDRVTSGGTKFGAVLSALVSVREETKATAEELVGVIGRVEQLSLFFPKAAKANLIPSALAVAGAMRDVFGDVDGMLGKFQEAQQRTEQSMKHRALLLRGGKDMTKALSDPAEFLAQAVEAVQTIPLESLQKFGDSYSAAFGFDKIELLRMHGMEAEKIRKVAERSREAMEKNTLLDKRWGEATGTLSEKWSILKGALNNTMKEALLPLVEVSTSLLKMATPMVEWTAKMIHQAPDWLKLGVSAIFAYAAFSKVTGLFKAFSVFRLGSGALGWLLKYVPFISTGLKSLPIATMLKFASALGLIGVGLKGGSMLFEYLREKVDNPMLKRALGFLSDWFKEMSNIILHPLQSISRFFNLVKEIDRYFANRKGWQDAEKQIERRVERNEADIRSGRGNWGTVREVIRTRRAGGSEDEVFKAFKRSLSNEFKDDLRNLPENERAAALRDWYEWVKDTADEYKDIQGLATGGIVKGSKNGRVFRVAENNTSEVVAPLAALQKGLEKAEMAGAQAITDAINAAVRTVLGELMRAKSASINMGDDLVRGGRL